MELRPLRSTVVTRFFTTMNLSDSRLGPASSPRGARVGFFLPPQARVSRVPTNFLCVHAVITTPADSRGACLARCVLFPGPGIFPAGCQPSPNSTGSASALPFSKLARCSLMLRPKHSLSALTALFLKCLIDFVSSINPPGGSGWSVSSRVGFLCLSHWRFVAFHGTLGNRGYTREAAIRPNKHSGPGAF